MATLRRYSVSLVNSLPSFSGRVLTFALALMLALGTSLGSPLAWAETTEINDEPDALQVKIEQTATDYDEAIANLKELESQIEDTRAKLVDLEATLPDQQKKSDEAFKALYKMKQESRSFVELILGSETIDDFFMTIEYLDRIQQSNLKEITLLSDMKAELESSEKALVVSKAKAEAEKTRAEGALGDAQAARAEAEQKALEVQKAEQAEIERVKAEQATQETGAAEKTPDPTPTPTPSPGEGSDNNTENPGWSADKKAFVAAWTGRIDAYLAGSPLAGQGKTFAEASWNYGVDPRWSPAISNTESSKGLYCFASHNAWGWGGVSWSSWEEAIDAHVRGLARGYGYTISIESAKKYCPPNWEHWYNATLAQMEMI